MRLKVGEARALLEQVMTALGHDAGETAIIVDHLLDSELRGLSYGGLPRAISVAERMGKAEQPRTPIRVLRESPVSAMLDGGDQAGYLVGHRATSMAIEKAKAQGIAVVGANRTWYTGMLSYYAEMATKQDLVVMATSHAPAWVAPHGAVEGRFGTNPICFGFPSSAEPVIWDIGTSAIMHGEVLLHRRLGTPLPEGVAFGPDGRPTRDPTAALAGAFAPWGGHKGAGLAMVVQLLGVLCDAPAMPGQIKDCAYLIVAMRPDLFMDTDVFKRNVAEYADAVRSAKPVEGGPPVRVPFDRSAAERGRRLREDAIDLPDELHARLQSIAQSGHA